jgi:ATP-dependent Lon protease
MKTRNSRNSKSMNNIPEIDSETNNTGDDFEYNSRGLPKRKTTLNNNYSNLFSSIESENSELEPETDYKNNDFLYEKFMKKKNNEYNIFSEDEKKYFSKLDCDTQQSFLNIRDELCKEDNLDKPLLFKILELDIDKSIKSSIYKKYKDLENLEKSSNEYYKLKSYIDNILSIPFGVSKDLDIENFSEYLYNSKNNLDGVIYGQENVKVHILEIISQYFSNKNCSGNIFGIYGPMGVGKTTIIKDGLSKVMNKPFNFISLGGAQDAAFLDGHSYTYEGSTYGKIVDCLIKSKCMNPIIYFDELDKISNTPKGEEIVNLLIHITDDSQNCNFQDKYFSGINIDLSKCIFVFSFNDQNKINNILKDRIQLIKVDGFDNKDKINIAKKFLIPKILEEFNLNNIRFKQESIIYFVETYSKEDGVRELKHILKKLISKINLIKYSNNDLMNYKITLKFPLNISLSLIKKLGF